MSDDETISALDLEREELERYLNNLPEGALLLDLPGDVELPMVLMRKDGRYMIDPAYARFCSGADMKVLAAAMRQQTLADITGDQRWNLPVTDLCVVPVKFVEAGIRTITDPLLVLLGQDALAAVNKARNTFAVPAHMLDNPAFTREEAMKRFGVTASEPDETG